MKLIAACLIVALVAAIQCNSVEAASAVGRYAPDRYEGIPEMCLMPMDMGVCRAKEKRFYFDTRRMKCAMFFWGGCGGNSNNFKSMDDCNKFCLDSYEEPDQKHSAPSVAPVKYNSRSSAKEVVSAKISNNNNNNSNDNTPNSSNNSANYKNYQVNKSKGYTNPPTKSEEYDDDDDNNN